MKKVITVMVSGICFAFTICTTANAQSSGNYVASANTKPNHMSDDSAIGSGDKRASDASKDKIKDAKTNLKASKASLRELKANVRSAESFKKEFSDGPAPIWTVQENGINASFSQDGIRTRVDYTRQGRWVHTLNYFTQDNTPEDVRKTIRFDYPKANITLAVKVLEGNMTFYIVELEDKTTFKQVTVFNDETNLVRELQKCH